MRDILKTFLFIITLTITAFANANTPRKIFGFFVNGIQNTWQEANNNARGLYKVAQIKSNLLGGTQDSFNLLYNKIPTGACPICKQVTDAWLQKFGLKLDMIIDDFMDIYIKFKGLPYQKGDPEYQKLLKEILPKYKAEEGVNLFIGGNLNDILDQYDKVISSSYKAIMDFINSQGSVKPYVLLLGHSQGSLYTHQLYKAIVTRGGVAQEQIATFNIATPEDISDNHLEYNLKELFGDNAPPSYITSTNDHVINGVRAITGSVSANYSQPTDFSGTGHNLIEHYLNPSIDINLPKKIGLIIDQYLIYLQFALYNDVYRANDYFGIIYYNTNWSSLMSPTKMLCNHSNCDVGIKNNEVFYLYTPYYEKARDRYLIALNDYGLYTLLIDLYTNNFKYDKTEFIENQKITSTKDNLNLEDDKDVLGNFLNSNSDFLPHLCVNSDVYAWNVKYIGNEPIEASKVNAGFHNSCFKIRTTIDISNLVDKFPQMYTNDMFQLLWIKSVGQR